MKKHPIEPKDKPTVDANADLLAHGSPTHEHAQDGPGGIAVEALYDGTGWDRMDEDIVARANNGKNEKSSTPIK